MTDSDIPRGLKLGQDVRIVQGCNPKICASIHENFSGYPAVLTGYTPNYADYPYTVDIFDGNGGAIRTDYGVVSVEPLDTPTTAPETTEGHQHWEGCYVEYVSPTP